MTETRQLLFLQKHWRNTVYSNVWIAIGATASCAQCYVILDYAINWWMLTFVFSGTLSIYNFQRLIKLRKGSYYIAGRSNWILRNQKVIWGETILGGLLGLFSILQLPSEILWILIPAGVVSIFYVVPLKRSGKSMREWPFIKIYLIAIIWSLMTAGVIFITENSRIFSGSTEFLLLFERFFFIVAITIPFDIRDMNLDFSHQRTIPQVLGEKRAKSMALLCLTISAIFYGFAFLQLESDFWELIAMTTGYIITAVLLVRTSSEKNEMYFAGWMDGALVIQGALMLLTLF